MSYAIRSTLCAFLALLCASPSLADDTGFEVFAIGERSSNGSNYAGLSFRMPLLASGKNDDRTAYEGLRLRFDGTRSNYTTAYDGVSGDGTTTTARFLLSYGVALSTNTTLTLVGGVSHRETKVRPATINAPADIYRTGIFLASELEVVLPDTGDLQMLVEHDATAGNFAAITYLHGTGALRFGPTFSHYSEQDYALSRAGLVVGFDIAEDAELRLTATRGWPSLSGAAADGVSSVQLQLRLAF